MFTCFRGDAASMKPPFGGRGREFRALFPLKPKILPKTRIYRETTSLWLSHNTSARSQINHRILIKLIKIIHFGGKNGLFKKKNRPVNKNQEVRGQVRTTFLETPHSGQLKLALFKFWCHLFFFHTPFFDCGPVFRGDTQAIEKDLLDFQMQNFMLNLLNQKII